MMSNIGSTAVICFSSGRGGVEIDASKLSKLLSTKSEVCLICKKGTFLESYCSENEGSFSVEGVSFSSRTFSLSMLFSVRKILKEKKIKNVIFFGASELKTLYFSFLGMGLNVVVRHGTTKTRPKRDVLHHLIYSCVSYHVSLTKYLLDNVKNIVPETAGVKHKLIYPSFRLEGVRDHEWHKGDVVRIIHVGRIAPGKGQQDAVQACDVLYKNAIEFELCLLGSPDDDVTVDSLNRIIETSPYKKYIHCIGHVNNVSEYLKKSDIFLYPSYGEGFGNVFVEAMMCGLPAITYNNTTFPEFRRLGFDFSMVEHANVAALGKELYDSVIDLEYFIGRCKVNIELAKEIFSEDKELYNWGEVLL